MKNLAVIDIGSNSISLQISEIKGKSYDIIEDYKETIRIGEDVFKTGIISESTIQSIMTVLEKMKVLIGKKTDKKEKPYIRAVATAPFRDASNSKDVVNMAKDKFDIDIEVIDGNEEARIVDLYASANFQMSKLNALTVDIGGGTLELIISKEGEITDLHSIPLGMLRLKNDFLKNNPPKNNEIEKLMKHIEKTLKDAGIYKKINKDIDTLIFTGGTITNIASIYNKREHLRDENVNFVDKKFIEFFLNELKDKTFEERNNIKGIDTQRTDIIQPAALIAEMLLDKTNCDGFFTIKGGLKNGLTIDTLNNHGIRMHFQENADVRLSRILEIGSKFFFEEEHARRTEKIAKILFIKLKDILKLNEEDYKLLEAASLLHDVGSYISYYDHHKHSYYLIKNSDFIGYSSNEIKIIANIARYHRKSFPKKSQKCYAELSSKNQELVQKLSAILRIADALDNSHKSAVKDIDVKIDDDSIKIMLKSNSKDADLSLEIQSAMDKKNFLEFIAKKEVTVK
ncbi:MAG: Ppx/GppA family phosphatase [Candidatus Acididesulfobacter guangdongensis]|uniref:Ppx/GppA family phosphatase n=1 Tax=Acididesulfobacter guangdongensis TaxID=2597225 RepID=A0A519BFS1_ACIG2|nr:MAG: Ppx/GppA family phosphatase [Candidatus Acididesulfobacter guangdongensis]